MYKTFTPILGAWTVGQAQIQADQKLVSIGTSSFTLPSATPAGSIIECIVGTTDYLTITAEAGRTIKGTNGQETSAGGFIRSNIEGLQVTLLRGSLGDWYCDFTGWEIDGAIVAPAEEYPIYDALGDVVLATWDLNKTYKSTGLATYDMPLLLAAPLATKITFIVGTGDYFRINTAAASADEFRHLVDVGVPAGYIRSNTQGSRIVIQNVGNAEWYVFELSGIWHWDM